MRWTRTLLVMLVATLATSSVPAMAAGAGAAPSPQAGDSWLYVMQSPVGSLTTKNGTHGTLVFQGNRALRFTDRPAHASGHVSIREALAELGFRAGTVSSAPNAAVTFGNRAAQPLEIIGASVRNGKVQLKVTGIGRPLRTDAGPMSLFIDNASIPGAYTLPTFYIDSTAEVGMVADTVADVEVTFGTDGTDVFSLYLTNSAPVQGLPANLRLGDITISTGQVSLDLVGSNGNFESGSITLNMTYTNTVTGKTMSMNQVIGSYTVGDFPS